MRTLCAALFMALSGALSVGVSSAQAPSDKISEIIVTFKFLPGRDIFYISYCDNGAELNRLYSLVKQYRAEIASGKIPVCVHGYCISLESRKGNLHTAVVRSNRVKPEPAKQSEPVADVARPWDWLLKPYSFSVRTNLLYDLFLLPTLGIEWRVNPTISIKLDGSFSCWGSKKGKVQKIWILNPEVRWYPTSPENFYVGLAGNIGEVNIYKYMLGSMASKDTGYQGDLWGVGIVAGYELPILRDFAIDFNLGLGYTRFEYDSFNILEATRVYKGKDQSKNFWGPTQVGVSFVWKLRRPQ